MRATISNALVGCAVALGIAIAPGRDAGAREPDAIGGDGVYGRLDADWIFAGSVGAGLTVGRDRRFLSSELRARYLDTAGVVLGYDEADAFSRNNDGGTLRRAFLVGVELRPMFPARFLKNLELRRGFLDLVIDSIGFDVAAYFGAIRGTDVARPGLSLGFGIELPLFGEVAGPWLRLATAVRFPATTLEGTDASARTTVLTATLSWHQPIELHAADAGDRPVR